MNPTEERLELFVLVMAMLSSVGTIVHNPATLFMRGLTRMPGFDAVKEATMIEHLVKEYMSHQNDKTTPEASRQAMNADRHELERKMADIWKTPTKLEKVTVELEKMTNETWSKQPNVSFDHDKEGNVTSMTFSPSRWTSEGLTSGGRDDHKVVVSFDKDKHQVNLYETVRKLAKDQG